MTHADKIEKKLEQMNFISTPKMREKILSDASQTMEQTINAAAKKPSVGRIIMKSRITKFAVTTIIAIVVSLPIAYGATKIIKHFLIDGISIVVKDSDKINTEKDAANAIQEFGRLYREGKAKETKPGVWVVTLSNGEEFAYSGNNPEWVGLSLEEKDKLRQAQNEENQ